MNLILSITGGFCLVTLGIFILVFTFIELSTHLYNYRLGPWKNRKTSWEITEEDRKNKDNGYTAG